MTTEHYELPDDYTDGETTYDAVDIERVHKVLDSQAAGGLMAQGGGIVPIAPLSITHDSSFKVTAGSGLSVNIAKGACIAEHSTYGAVFLLKNAASVLSGLGDESTLYIYASIETSANDSRETALPLFVASAFDTLDGGELLAVITTTGGAVTAVTDMRRQAKPKRTLTHRGAHSSTARYAVDDVVKYDDAWWIALTENTNVTPEEGATWTVFGGAGAVASVNGQTGTVVLDAEDVGAAAEDHAHTLADITDAGTAAALDVAASGDAASGEVVKGNDTRLSDDRDPNPHAATHRPGGSDAIPTAAASGLANANAEGSSTSLARADHTHKRDVRVKSSGSDVGTRNAINFSGDGVTVTDDAANDRVNVAISAGEGGSDEKVAVYVDGAQEGSTARALNLDGDDFTAAEDAGNDRIDIALQSALDSNARVAVRVNGDSDTGARRRLNLIEGTGIEISAADDSGDEEIDITITSTAAAGSKHVIQEEGTPLTSRAALNFIGDAVTATDDVGNDATKVTIDAYTETEVDSLLALRALLAGGNTFTGTQIIEAVNQTGTAALNIKTKGAVGGTGGVAGMFVYDNAALAGQIRFAGDAASGGRYMAFFGGSDRDGNRTPFRVYTLDAAGSLKLGMAGGSGTYASNTGFGVSAPTGRVHIAAGTAVAGTAPLKLTSGTLLTTPENGVFEYDGTDLYFTTGGTRKNLSSPAGASDLDDLGDVAISSPTTGQVLTYDGSEWVNDDAAGGSGAITLSDAATIATDAALGDVFNISSATDRTLGAPTNATDGMKRVWRWTNTDSSAHTLTLASGAGGFAFGARVQSIPVTQPGTTTIIGAIFNSAADRWQVVGHDVF